MAFAYLLMIDGIQGDSKLKGFEDQIQLHSAQFGVGRAISATSRTTKRESSAPSISELVVTKAQDRASVPLFLESLNGKGKNAVFTIVSLGESPTAIYRISLSGTMVSGYSVSGGGDLPTESLSLNFTKIFVEHRDPETGVIRRGGWDLAGSMLVTS